MFTQNFIFDQGKPLVYCSIFQSVGSQPIFFGLGLLRFLSSAQARLEERVAFHSQTAQKLAAWMEANLPQGVTVYRLPAAHHRRMSTSNAIERVNQELKRRTRVAALFPNEASLPRLTTALLCEQSDDWSTGNIYLKMNPSEPPQT